MATAENIAQYLDDSAFPATREECIVMAEENGAPDEFLEAIGRLPEGLYNNVHEVWALVNAMPD